MMYIVHPYRTQRLPDLQLWSKWHLGTDLPDPAYWRQTRDGQDIPEAERSAVPGEQIGLVEIVSEPREFLGIPYSHETPHMLCLVRLEEDDTYTVLHQSQRYLEAIASGALCPFVR